MKSLDCNENKNSGERITVLKEYIVILKAICCYLAIALATPSFSTASVVSLRPAVSLSNTGYPPILTWVSMTSRVVPAISVTMAAGLRPEEAVGLVKILTGLHSCTG